MAKLTKLGTVLGQLNINMKELSLRMGISVPMLQQMSRNTRIPLKEEKLEIAKEFVREIAKRILEEDATVEKKNGDLEKARKEYTIATGNEVPNRYKNNVEWLEVKTMEALS